jgi:Tfp pilus assembly protein PilF
MLDALRHHKATPPERGGSPKRGADGQNVPAPLAQAFGQKAPEEYPGTGKRLGLALVLVAVTALLVWQVAAMNGLLPAGPLSRLLRPVVAERARTSPDPRPPSQATPLPEPTRMPASAAAPPEPAAPTPAAAADSRPRVPQPAAARAEAAPAPPVQTERRAAVPSGGPGVTVRNGSGPTAPPSRPTGETDHFKLALYYHRVGDFENALIHYRAVIAADELNAEAHNNLGLLYQGKGLYDDAIQEFQRATFIDPRYEKAHNNLGVAFLRSGKTDAAIAEFRGIVARDARNIEALTNLALAFKAAGRTEEAREMLQRVLTINGRYAQAHYNLALLYEERAEWQRAIEHFEQFLANAGPESAALTVDVRTRVQALRSKLQ